MTVLYSNEKNRKLGSVFNGLIVFCIKLKSGEMGDDNVRLFALPIDLNAFHRFFEECISEILSSCIEQMYPRHESLIRGLFNLIRCDCWLPSV